MINTFLIFCGAGIGGVLRFWFAHLTNLLLGRNFPYGTLVVNISGCLLMGILYVFIMERFANFSPQLRPLILIGFLGGYTTFSSFTIETYNLFEKGNFFFATLNVLLSVILCLAATWVGIKWGRKII